MHIELCCPWVCVTSGHMVVCGVRCVVRGMWLADIRVWRGVVWRSLVKCGLVRCCLVWNGGVA